MTITTNFPPGPRLLVAGSRIAAVFGRLGSALSAKRPPMPNLTGWFSTIMLAGGAFFPAAAVCSVPAADVARVRFRARTRTL
jgi:hypothetical protein